MINIHVVYCDESQLKEFMKLKDEFPGSSFHFLSSIKDKSKAWKLKLRWGARKDPFAIIENDNKPLKAFYSEADNDIVKSIREYGKLHEHLFD